MPPDSGPHVARTAVRGPGPLHVGELEVSGQVCQHRGARSLQVHTLWGQGPVDVNAVF